MKTTKKQQAKKYVTLLAYIANVPFIQLCKKNDFSRVAKKYVWQKSNIVKIGNHNPNKPFYYAPTFEELIDKVQVIQVNNDYFYLRKIRSTVRSIQTNVLVYVDKKESRCFRKEEDMTFEFSKSLPNTYARVYIKVKDFIIKPKPSIFVKNMKDELEISRKSFPKFIKVFMKDNQKKQNQKSIF